MIDRYTTPEMRSLWSQQTKTDFWLQVELAVCAGLEEFSYIPAGTTAKIRAGATFDLDRMAELEKETKHDVMAFVKNVQEGLGAEGKFLHYGITSYDVVDTAQCMQMRDGIDIIIGKVDGLLKVLRDMANKYKQTPQIGRTHAIHAEPITFGFKLLGWIDELYLHLGNLHRARQTIGVGKISGAVGTHANIDPAVEQYVCERLDLGVVPVSTQIITRQRHITVLNALAALASSLERFATEIRHLARTEVLEVQERFSKGQKGSSAMPHKRNPWNCETVSGLARVVRAMTIPMMECAATWHERDLSNSSTERIVIPGVFTLTDWMTWKFTDILSGLNVYPERMLRNLEMTGGLVFSESIMLLLIERGLSREEAYSIVQGHAAAALDEGADFRERVSEDPRISAVLTAEELGQCFDVEHHLRRVPHSFAQCSV